MKSIKDVYKIGTGPSSSHTMGPEKACLLFLEHYSEQITSIEVFLYDSLALTGKGHLTDYIIKKVLNNYPVKINFEPDVKLERHENSMKICALLKDTQTITWTIYSIGGGDIEIEEIDVSDSSLNVYPHNNLHEINAYCQKNNLSYFEYIKSFEPEIFSYLNDVWIAMKESIENGLTNNGVLPGSLKIQRKAPILYSASKKNNSLLLDAYAYAVNEENASGGIIVTAPTCGACGVLPSVLKFYQDKLNLTDEIICGAIAVAGLFGAVVKENATVSGAEAGCQAEVGVATSMAAAAISFINSGDNIEIESSAEIALEHQIGLTCDPVLGYVQIPCIQRNAVAANKAQNSYFLAKEISHMETVDFDTIVEVMYTTGKDLKVSYRETSIGGLAKYYKNKKK